MHTEKKNTIDLNSDLGEHSNSHLDEQIMLYLSSCNIACGAHAGNEASVRRTIDLAKKSGVAIGAHPSYPDRENFGREVMNISPGLLAESIKRQIELVSGICKEEGVELHHVKPHGALYNLAAIDLDTSDLICNVILEIDPELKLYGLAHSVTEKVARHKHIQFAGEAFADRAYEPNKTLRSRSKKGAVLTDVSQVLKQVEELALNHRAFSKDWIEVHAQTICLHSDTPGAVTLAKQIKQHLVSKGIHIAAV